MVLGRIFQLLAIYLFAATLLAGQRIKPVGPDNSTDKSKPNAGIPLAAAERHKRDDPADQRIAQQIRWAMTSDKSLSLYTRNVTIVCRNGMVTLRGPVRSGDEKQNIEEKAAAVVRSNHVRSELAVRSIN